MIERTERNAKARLNEVGKRKGDNFYKNYANVPKEPIIIASTEDIGTINVRANHIDSAIEFCINQERLKAAGAPI